MPNARETLHVGEPLAPGQAHVAWGAGCGLADIENPTDRAVQIHAQLLVSCGNGAQPAVFAQPRDVEVPAQSTLSFGLGLTCEEESSLGLGPAAVEPTGDAGGYVFRPVLNEATRLANLNAALILSGAQTVDPDDLRWEASPQVAAVELPSGEPVYIGLSLEEHAGPIAEAIAAGLIDDPGIGKPVPPPDEEEFGTGHTTPVPNATNAHTGGLLVTWDDSPWRALETVSGDTADSGAGSRPEFGGGDPYDDGEAENPDATYRPPASAWTEDDANNPDAMARPPASGPRPGAWAKGTLAVRLDVGLSLTARVDDDLSSAAPLAEPHLWTVIEPGSTTTVEAASGATTTFRWPEVPIPELQSMPDGWLSHVPGTATYVRTAVENAVGRQFSSSIPRAEDSPVVRSTGGMRRNRSSIPGAQDGPVRPTAAPVSAAVWGWLLRSPAVVLALLVLAGVLAVGALLLTRGGNSETSLPASSAATSVPAAGSGASAGSGTAATPTGSSAGAEGSPEVRGTVLASGPVGQQFGLIAMMFETAAATALRRGEVTIGADGRQVAGAPSIEWDAEITVLVATDEDDDELYLVIQGPSAVLGDSCGEVDLIVDGQHVGDGLDFCAAGATAPGYFSNIVRYEKNLEGDWVAVLIPTGLTVPDNGDVAGWLHQTNTDGSYEAVERFARGLDIPSLPITGTAGTAGDGILALAVPRPAGRPAVSAPTQQPTELPAVVGVIEQGFYAVVFTGIRQGSCGNAQTYTQNMSLEITNSRAGDADHNITFFDGQSRASGLINVETGVFVGVGDQYSGTLTGDFSRVQTITRTLELPGCTATYLIEVQAQ